MDTNWQWTIWRIDFGVFDEIIPGGIRGKEIGSSSSTTYIACRVFIKTWHRTIYCV
jgi:hypothetical protein